MTTDFRFPRTTLLALLSGLVSAGDASAQEDGLRLGLIAPADGSYALLGDQARLALEAFAESSGAEDVTVVTAPEPCEENTGAEAATVMVEADVDAVIGLFCAETVLAAMPVLAEADIPAITVSIRAEIVMEDAREEGWPLFRLAPAANAEAPTIAAIVAERWVDEPFALIDDGTIYGRDLVEEIRLELQSQGIEPTFTDNYRPAEEKQFGLVRRLADAGASHVFVGGDRADIAIMARDAAAANLDLTFMGGDALRAAEGEAPLPDGVLAVIAERKASGSGDGLEAIAGKLDEAGMVDARAGDGYYLPVFAAAEILAAASVEDEPTAALEEETFQTVLGPVGFGNDQASDGDPYRLMISENGRFRPLDGQRAELR